MAAVSANWLLLKSTLPVSAVRRKRKADEAQLEDIAPAVKRERKDDVRLTKYLALDCEMVGVGDEGTQSVLARVSIVNFDGDVIYDTFVKPDERVTDFRTEVSGVRRADLKKALDFRTVQSEVAKLIERRIVIGHALHNDWKALMLSHPASKQRDTARFATFKQGRKKPSLRILAQRYLNLEIQSGEHSSIEDARATLALYKMFQREWEQSLHVRKPVQSDGKDQAL